MQIETTHVADAFASMLTEPAPADTIDLGRVLTEGRRRRTRRRLGGAAAATATACLAGALVPTLLAAHGPTAPAQVGPAATSTAPTTDARRDPLLPTATFGWLPAGMNQVTYMGNTIEQAVVGPSGDTPGIGSIMLSTGGWVQTQTSTTGMRVSGQINGHPAYTRSRAAGANGPGSVSGNEVYFQSASGQWVQLSGDVLPLADTLKVAQHLVFGSAKAIPLPFRWSGQSTNPATPEGSYTTVDGTFSSAVIGTEINGENVGVVAVPADSPGDGIAKDSIPRKSVTRILDGLKITVTISTNSNTTPVTGDPASYFKEVTSLGPNPADWTRDVLTTGNR
ncbi:hypothetical protein [Streptacidiphilus sp. P02-A3a]|uniref:hypothetical protein n=1 Tax=Streptacidiphilus sp. P02-A3a TaxID=2704468 RepID=UPI0015FE0643|nr:hypothetical protein [Streptacidiphilus sp. P02-A3a]QMU68056.1 hypothetical protein GXP74_07315 [Streptacidiphilus sp. P02-A3a]